MKTLNLVTFVVILTLTCGGFRTLTMAQTACRDIANTRACQGYADRADCGRAVVQRKCFETCQICGVCDGIYFDFVMFGLLGTTCVLPSRPALDHTIRFSVPSQWDDICRKVKDSADCLQTVSSQLHASTTTISLGGSLLVLAPFPYFRSDDYRVSSLYQFPAQVCDNGHMKSDVMKYMNADLSCLTQNEIRTFYACFENLDCKMEYLFTDTPLPGSDELLRGATALLASMSVDALKCMKGVHDIANCDAESKKFIEFLAKLQIYSILDADKLEEIVWGSSTSKATHLGSIVMTLQFAAFFLALAK